ncbi:hypothetical protein I5677_05555 [Mobilitalea sibirica]|uniref:Zinc ribbon domain-containing protein n=1 Tax=Mobilitalea sibirica TaxID=1462919 RepID=A0A8J7HAV5_9FIRM|nr:hypothetical protein [Mobilitalea sibirica]MBH1940361.1 hypothetical protein [Mobilitalea sibirica]
MLIIRHIFNRKKKVSYIDEKTSSNFLETDDEFSLEEDESLENRGKASVLKEDNMDIEDDREYEIVEREILPAKIICPDCGGITLEGLEFCDKCGGEL